MHGSKINEIIHQSRSQALQSKRGKNTTREAGKVTALWSNLHPDQNQIFLQPKIFHLHLNIEITVVELLVYLPENTQQKTMDNSVNWTNYNSEAIYVNLLWS